MSREQDERIPEIALCGDLTEHESELTDRLLDVEPGGECLIYFDSPGGGVSWPALLPRSRVGNDTTLSVGVPALTLA